MLRPLEDVLALLTCAGFTGDDALHIYRLLFGFLYGHILNELQEVIERPEEPTTYSGSVCTGFAITDSPYCVRWHRSWPPTTAPPNSTTSSISCCRA